MKKFSYQFSQRLEPTEVPGGQIELFKVDKRLADQELGLLITSKFDYDLIPIHRDNILTFYKEIYCLTHSEVIELKCNIKLIESSLPNNPKLEKIKNILKIE